MDRGIKDSKGVDMETVKEILSRGKKDITIKGLLSEICIGYIFCSIFQGLGPMIWFYPLNELDITGYEAFVLLLFSPILMAIPGVLRLIQNHRSLTVLRLITLYSLLSFQAPSTLIRLISLAVGSAASMLVLTACLWSRNLKTRYLVIWGQVIGFLLHTSSRIWFLTFIPTWWSSTSNCIVFTVGLIATVDKFFSDGDVSDDDLYDKRTKTYMKPSATPYVYSKSDQSKLSASDAPFNSFPTFVTGLGCGSLFYLTHACFGEVSVISRWVVRGYPNTGPDPTFCGALVLCSLFIGVQLIWYDIAHSKVWWIVGSISFMALYFLPTWSGFIGGLVLGVYTMSLWPEFLERLVHCPPTKVMVITISTYLAEIFFSVWTIAYNFVPGGIITRERTDALIVFIVTCIGSCLLLGQRRYKCSCIDRSFALVAKTEKMIKLATVIIFVFGIVGFSLRCDPSSFRSAPKKEPRNFRAAIWTYHFGYDNVGWPSLEKSAWFLNASGADVITLLESDASKPFLGNNDLGLWLSQTLKMHVDFGPSTRDHTWGNLILSKYPIVSSKHHLLPSPEGELAPGVTATVNISGSLVDFVATHMGNDRDDLDRRLQAQTLADELHNSKNPVVFLGYVTSSPGSRDYRHLLEAGRVKDIDPTDHDRWCEYIMYRGLIRLGYARVSHGGLSDTELQMAHFNIPIDTNVKDNDYLETDPSKVDPSLHFTSKFGSLHHGHGYFFTHHYHMSTPKYFLPK